MSNKFFFFCITILIFFSCEKDEDNIIQYHTPSNSFSKTSKNKQNSKTTGSFSALTYNVAGLPSFISGGNPDKNTATIGRLISNYNIVHVQEDFNYHATLYANDSHPYRTPTSGGVPFGDGLNTLSNVTYLDFQRFDWNNCNGADCLTPKGFTVARHLIAPGVYIDFYNVHPNAGSNSKDQASRRANILQLKGFINHFSKGNAVIVMGDLNCRYTRNEDNIRELTTPPLNLKDVWVELVKNGKEPEIGSPALVCDNSIYYTDPQCEIVDKVFYKGNNFIKLTATSFSYEEDIFRKDNGDMLSDHRPIKTIFSWELTDDLILSNQFGGPHGDSFTDVNKISDDIKIESVFLRSGKRLDQVGVTFNKGLKFKHGGSGGSYKALVLNKNEYITEVFLCKGKKNGNTRIFKATFKTNQNRTLSGGSHTNDNVTYKAPTGWQIIGFHGRAGDEVDRLGVIYAPVKNKN